ncbi:MAG TPA: peptide chain release factor N(5)-glutamine methyltransferase [Lachnospiraceae bacterium]|nr:peptide chain release factor N(5)-glutamine methyltransferase [Lachnospiraceae bacterium]
MVYSELYHRGKEKLLLAGIGEAELEARLLLEYVCKTTRSDLLAHGDREVAPDQESAYKDLIGRRMDRIPLQHLTGEQEFMGLPFSVNEHVLIPRQDTEILVEEVLRNLHDGMRILDMCTGSGCILISLLHYSNDCEGVGADISEEALAVARENARKLLGGGEIHFISGDLFTNISGKFDVIVSNPPYIRRNVIDTLMPEVREHEPKQALDGGEDGLDFYRRIIGESREYLFGGGMLFFEIGYDQKEAVCTLMKEAGFLEIQAVKDYAGLDRVVYGTRSFG